jgi:hypothetical protein
MHFISAILSLVSLAVVTARPPICEKRVYNQTFSASNTATCIKDDVTCDFHSTACYGKVSCLGEGPSKCCVVNTGITDCDGSSESEREYTIEDGSTCFFKGGQSKTTYFNVCKSKCNPTSPPTKVPTGEPTFKPTFMPTKASCRAYTQAANLYNKTLSIANKAICKKADDCNMKTTACMGYVICDPSNAANNNAIKCCVANPGKGDEFCDGSTEGQNQYYLQNGAECYFKKGQVKTTYFQVCNGYKYCNHPTATPTGKPVPKAEIKSSNLRTGSF